eukprot:1450496-Pleurochrysis_carterae.AAC.1
MLRKSSARVDASTLSRAAGHNGRPPRARGGCRSSLSGRPLAVGKPRCRRGDVKGRRRVGVLSARHAPAWLRRSVPRARRDGRWKVVRLRPLWYSGWLVASCVAIGADATVAPAAGAVCFQ